MQTSIYPQGYMRQHAELIDFCGDETISRFGLYMATFDTVPSLYDIELEGTKKDRATSTYDSLFPSLQEEGFVILHEDVDYESRKLSDLDEDESLYDHDHRIVANIEKRLMIEFSGNSNFYFYYDCTDATVRSYIDSFIAKAKELFIQKKKREVTARVNYITYSSIAEEFELKKMNIVPRHPFSLDTCYNEDFAATDDCIRKFLATPNQSGLVILHGQYGAGKSSYLKDLVKTSKNKFVFVPMDVASKLASPEFIDFVHESLCGSVIILEDCEQLLISRSSSKDGVNTGLAALLNMTDGILGDTVNLKFICTFNNDLCKIDPALLRPGRLVARYEFQKLDADKTTALMNSLGHQGNFEAMTLAEIFNHKK